MLKVWNVVLVSLAFCLSLFGTFLTRSGVVNSIHSFTQSDDRPVVPRFHRRRGRGLDGAHRLAAAAAPLDARSSSRSSRARRRSSTTTCCSWRSASRSSGASPGRSCPRPCAARRSSSGRPYYDFFLRIFGLPLLLLMGIGPLDRLAARLAARPRTHVRLAGRRRGRRPASSCVVLGAGSSIPGLIAYTFSAFVLAAIALEFVRGTTRTARRSPASPGHARSPRSSGATGGATAATSSTSRSSCSRSGSPARARTTRSSRVGSRRGQSLAVGGYTAHLRAPHRARHRATRPRCARSWPSSRGGGRARHAGGRQELVQDRGPSRRSRTRSASARTTSRAEDLFVIAEQVNDDGSRLLPRLRQAARQPHLARGHRLPARLGDRALAGRTRGAPARGPVRARPARPWVPRPAQ